VDENFKYVQLVSGSKELLPRWRRVLRVENGAIGFAVGHEYVKRRFPPEARAQVLDILRAQSWIEVDAGDVGAAGAVHQDERDQGHAQDDDDGGEEPPGYVLGEHQPLRVKPGGSGTTSTCVTCRR